MPSQFSFPSRSILASLAAGLLACCTLANPGLLKAQVTFGGVHTTPVTGLNYPLGVAVDQSGNLYLSTLSGILLETPNGSGGYTQSTITTSALSYPGQLAVDTLGDIFIPDTFNNRVIEEAPNGSGGYNETTVASHVSPRAVAIDTAGNLFVATSNGLYKETFAAGTYTDSAIDPNLNALGVAVDTAGNLYVSDAQNNQIVLETPASGSYTASSILTGLNQPAGIIVDASGILYIADSGDNHVFKAVPDGSGGYNQYLLTSAIGGLQGIAFDQHGNLFLTNNSGAIDALQFNGITFGSVPVNSTSSSQLVLPFTIAAGTTIGSRSFLVTGVSGKDLSDAGSTTCAAQTYTADTACVVSVNAAPLAPGLRQGAVTLNDGSSNPLATVLVNVTGSGPQIAFNPGTSAVYTTPYNNMGALAVDSNSNSYVAVYDQSAIIKFTPNGVSSLAVNTPDLPKAVAIDGAGNIYTGGTSGIVYKFTPQGVQSTYFTIPNAARPNVNALAFDAYDNLYIADQRDNKLLKVTPDGKSSTIGSVQQIYGMAVDPQGNLFVADSGARAVYKFTPDGVQTTIINSTILGQTFRPSGIAIDAAGTIYLANANANGTSNQLTPGVYILSLNGTLTPLVTNGFHSPADIRVDPSGNLFVTDGDFNASRPTTLTKINREAKPSAAFATTTPAGTTDTTDGTAVVTAVNIGTQNLNFASVTYPADFPEDGSGINDCTAATSLNPGASCTFTIDFAPHTAHSTATTESLVEAVTFTTNFLNLPNHLQAVNTSGTATWLTAGLALSASSATPSYGSSYSISATASGAGSAPTGMVTFYDNRVFLATASLVNGVATIQPSLTAQAHSITASYSGDSQYTQATASSILVSPVKLTPTIVLGTSQGSVNVGTSVTFTATLTALSGGLIPTGTVRFLSTSSGLLATSPVINGVATFTTSTLPGGGTAGITAIYSGDLVFLTVTSARLLQTVNKYTPSVLLTFSPNNSTSATPVVFTASVSGAGPAPTGTVRFYSTGGVLLGTGTLNAGIATLFVPSRPVGIFTVSAVYSGDVNYSGFTYNTVERVIP